jgi:hypothetical protein
MNKTNLPFQLCFMPSVSQLDTSVEIIYLSDTSHSLVQDEIQEREKIFRRRLWKNYAVKFLERAANTFR